MEWSHVMQFIDIYKLRLSEKLQLDICYDAGLNTYKIPPLLLFPLIENAFKYVGGKLIIKIEAQLLEKDTLVFSVYNTKNPVSTLKPGGIGLENLKKRLELIYPQKHQLEISSLDEECNVQLTLQLV
jgi:sensor histidine kinase YesM